MEHRHWDAHDPGRGRAIDITTRRTASGGLVLMQGGQELGPLAAFPGAREGQRRASYEWTHIHPPRTAGDPITMTRHEREMDGICGVGAQGICYALGLTALVYAATWLIIAHGWLGVIAVGAGLCGLGRVIARATQPPHATPDENEREGRS